MCKIPCYLQYLSNCPQYSLPLSVRIDVGMPYLHTMFSCRKVVVDVAERSGRIPNSTHLVNVSIATITLLSPCGASGFNPTTVSSDHYYSGALPLLVGMRKRGNLNFAPCFCRERDDSAHDIQSVYIPCQ